MTTATADPPTVLPVLAVSPSPFRAVFEGQASRRRELAATTAQERVAKLRRIAAWTERNAAAIREAGAADFGKPAPEVDITEIYPVLGEVRHVASHLAGWMRGKRVPKTMAMASTSARLVYEPKGRVLILSPWNYPFNLTVGPLISAIAAGNSAILKPSEMTPHMAVVLERMVGELFAPDEVAIFTGDAGVASELLALPFDHIFFTGSPRVGQIVMKAAAEHLATVTLELGGKSPVIVDKSAHLGDLAKKLAWGKFINCGQTCIAPDYVLVERSRHDALVDALRTEIEKAYGADAAARRASPDYARLVNAGHWQRLRRLFEGAVAGGAKVAIGGDHDEASRYFGPTVLTGVPAEAGVLQEEIFGPLLPIVPFDDLEEALDYVRGKQKPLALYVFGDGAAAGRVIAGSSAGGTCVNDIAIHFLHHNLPFGGINHSGHGSSHGFFGFKAFSHERAVLRHHRFSLLKLMAPPYGPRVRRLIDLTLKYF